MAVDEGLVAWVEEAMAPIGTVTRRAMMGSATLYCGGTIFAIIADGHLCEGYRMPAGVRYPPKQEAAGLAC